MISKTDLRMILVHSFKISICFADKTRNIYEMGKSQYEKVLTDSITKTCKQSNNNVYNTISLEGKHVAKKLEIADRVECMAKKPAYIKLKDHKKNFNINPKCFLINPAKRQLEKVAKIIVEKINKTVREKLHYNQWRNKSNVLDWFQNIADKVNCIFIQFDIEEFYPSITKHLVLKSIEHAKLCTSKA